jgi:hypothetical protein
MAEIAKLVGIFVAAALLFAAGVITIKRPERWQQRALPSHPRSRFVQSAAYLLHTRIMGAVVVIFAILVFCCGLLYVGTLLRR